MLFRFKFDLTKPFSTIFHNAKGKKKRGGSEIGATTAENLLYLLQKFSTSLYSDHAFSDFMTIYNINCFSRKLIYNSSVSNKRGVLISLDKWRG